MELVEDLLERNDVITATDGGSFLFSDMISQCSETAVVRSNRI
jgi:hypothetical protein